MITECCVIYSHAYSHFIYQFIWFGTLLQKMASHDLRQYMMTSSNGNIFLIQWLALCERNPSFTVGFLSQRPVTWSFGVFFFFPFFFVKSFIWHIQTGSTISYIQHIFHMYTNNIIHTYQHLWLRLPTCYAFLYHSLIVKHGSHSHFSRLVPYLCVVYEPVLQYSVLS